MKSFFKFFAIFITAVIVIGLASCSTKNEPDSKTGGLPGKFSVSADKKVEFSKGNLQYQASTKTWRFANNQYDIIGNENKFVGNIGDGWIDVFGYGTGYDPLRTSENYKDYALFIDWGCNPISNGGNQANLWRTLEASEWHYLIWLRPNANDLLGFGSINGINGIFLLPDDWTIPDGAVFYPISQCNMEYDYGIISNSDPYGDNYSQNTFTIKEWLVLESSGAVFLPAAGYKSYDSMSAYGREGFYWSSTWDGYNGEHIYFDRNKLISRTSKYHPWNACSVRLVK